MEVVRLRSTGETVVVPDRPEGPLGRDLVEEAPPMEGPGKAVTATTASPGRREETPLTVLRFRSTGETVVVPDRAKPSAKPE